MSSWEIKYSLDNDKTRFWWADETNGKGVIYYMKDEYGNECPYDFKNIQFKRDNTYYYTFSWVDENNAVKDLSIVGNTSIYNDEGEIAGCYGNKIGVTSSYEFGLYVEDHSNLAIVLTNNVLISTYSYEVGVFYGCKNNTFEGECYGNTLWGNCRINTFGDGCTNNTFGNNPYNNIFGNECKNNTFGNDCSNNTFGKGCSNNRIGDACAKNTFGSECRANTFGSGCRANTFGSECSSNTFGSRCRSNTFGDGCTNNTFGDDCFANIVDNGVKRIAPQPTTGDLSMQGIHIHYGVTGQFTVTRGANYTQDVRTANDATITV